MAEAPFTFRSLECQPMDQTFRQDPHLEDAASNERKHVYETSSLISESKSITAFAEGDRTGLWTCAVAAAVFWFEVPAGWLQSARSFAL